MGEEFRPVAPIDPTNLRPLLFLDVAHEIMRSPDWSHRAVTVVLESHTGPGRFSFYGANHPDTIDAVHERRVDISTVNPAAMLTMAHRGVGVYDRPAGRTPAPPRGRRLAAARVPVTGRRAAAGD